MTTTNRQPSVLHQLRALMPRRPLTRREAFQVAELQASRLIELAGIKAPPVPEGIVTTLPRTRVERQSPMPVSGYAMWSGGRWQIALNGAEPYVRQRFSLFHEFKHVLDHSAIHAAYTLVDETSRHDWTERLCDYFAACILMPRAWVKTAYCNEGIQSLPALARRFGVSQAAMRIRLHQLGLTSINPRCRYHRIPGFVAIGASWSAPTAVRAVA